MHCTFRLPDRPINQSALLYVPSAAIDRRVVLLRRQRFMSSRTASIFSRFCFTVDVDVGDCDDDDDDDSGAERSMSCTLSYISVIFNEPHGGELNMTLM